jgi:hypothetical protein
MIDSRHNFRHSCGPTGEEEEKREATQGNALELTLVTETETVRETSMAAYRS